jgi:hypothetical protein
LFSLPPGTEMVHFPGLPSPTYGFSRRSSGMSLSGLPHSEILGSKPVCGSPKLFAAYHVLHRLLAPRHSPYALSSLTIFISRNSELPLGATALCTLRVCGRKTTVCRIFNCQRSRRFGLSPSALARPGPHGPASPSRRGVLLDRDFLSVSLGGASPGPWLASLARPIGLAPFRSPELSILRPASSPVQVGRSPICPRSASSNPRRFEQSARRGTRAPAERKRRRRLPTKQSGEYRARTGDLLVANQALSQLS